MEKFIKLSYKKESYFHLVKDIKSISFRLTHKTEEKESWYIEILIDNTCHTCFFSKTKFTFSKYKNIEEDFTDFLYNDNRSLFSFSCFNCNDPDEFNDLNEREG